MLVIPKELPVICHLYTNDANVPGFALSVFQDETNDLSDQVAERFDDEVLSWLNMHCGDKWLFFVKKHRPNSIKTAEYDYCMAFSSADIAAEFERFIEPKIQAKAHIKLEKRLRFAIEGMNEAVAAGVYDLSKVRPRQRKTRAKMYLDSCKEIADLEKEIKKYK